MSPELWQRVKDITADALELPAAERAGFAAAAAGGDEVLLREVLRLIGEAEKSADDLLHESFWKGSAPPGADRLEAAPQLPARFEMVREAGRGGMGIVFECFDRDRRLRVALKTLSHVSPLRLYSFKREFRALSDITHPNLASLYELVREGDQYFLSMEYIDGAGFLKYLREPGPGCGLQRLREVLPQIAAGLETIHGTGKLHRDLKPSNVMVTAEGRAVILDFGLIAEIQPDRFGVQTGVVAAGTLSYMAPEQREGIVTPASDWYSLGVMVHEALTDTLPSKFGGDLALPPGTPADLAEICRGLLALEPAQRIGAARVFELLGEPAGGRPPAARPAVRLMGRSAEFALLTGAYHALAERGAAVVLMRGTSGTGKTVLSEHFLESASGGDALILTGRCYERETVPYKAVDSLIDQLSQLIATLPREDAEAIVPRDAVSLAAVFPVLEFAPAFMEACFGRSPAADPVELRRRAFLAVREMLVRLGERSRLVLWLDDLQWMDEESAWLIGEAIRSPDAPRMMLLCTYRSSAEATNPGLKLLLEVLDREPLAKVEIDLQPLDFDAAVKLAESLLSDTGGDARASAAEIARDSGGLPFFICELAHLAHTGATAELSLDGLIWSRARDLDDEPLRLLNLAVVAGCPIEQRDLFAAAGLPARNPVLLNQLAAMGLIRSAGPRESDVVETYHDRIREAISARLNEGEATRLHLELANALESGGRTDPETLATHLEAATEFARAGPYYSQAADRAARAVAFHHAATLYQKALRHSVLAEAERGAMERRLAEVLADGGRSGEASGLFFSAAERSAPGEGVYLKSIGAYHLCAAGMIDEGREHFGDLLGKAGRRIPGRDLRTLITSYWRVLRLSVPDRIETAAQPDPDRLALIDLLWFAAAGIGSSDMVSGFVLLLDSVRLALKAREPLRVIRGLSFHAAFAALAGQGHSPKIERELRACRELSERIGAPPQARATLALTEAIRAYNRGFWPQALREYGRAESVLVEECRGLNWELSFARTGKLWTLISLGAAEKLKAEASAILEDALSRGDRFTAINAGSLPLPYGLMLVSDRPAEARATVEHWLRDWTRHGYGLQNALGFLATEWAWLYEGCLLEAFEVLEKQWRSVRGSGILRLPTSAVLFWETRGRVLAGMANASNGRRRDELLGEVSRIGRRLRKVDALHAPAFAEHLEAVGRALRRDRHGAVEHMRRAIEIFEKCEMRVHVLAFRRRLGQWIGGAEGQKQIAEADREMRAEKIADPMKVSRMHTVEIGGF